LSSANFQDLARYSVATNDGSGTLTLEYAQNYSGGSYSIYDAANQDTLPYATGASKRYSTQRENQKNPIFRILADPDTGIVTNVQLVDPGIDNYTGDVIIILQPGSGHNCVITFNSNFGANPIAFQRISGGVGYFYNPIVATDAYTIFPDPSIGPELLPNTAQIYNPGKVYSNADGRIGYADLVGTIKNFITEPNVVSAYTGTFGNIQTIHQAYPIDLATQPDPDNPGSTISQPTDGWISEAFRDNATYYQDVDLKLIVSGSGYTIGGPYQTTGGTGTGFTVYITKVSETGGQVLGIVIDNIGTNYLQNDLLSINSGDSNCKFVLNVPRSQELDLRNVTYVIVDVPVYRVYPFLFFDCKILSGGTGYSIASSVTTTCPTFNTNASATGLLVDILQVDPITGSILDIRVSGFNSPAQLAYQIGYRILITGAGSESALIELIKPRKAKQMEFTNGGTNYISATGVTTYNITLNSLVVFCKISGGQVTPASYSSSDLKPSIWNLKRYSQNDSIAFLQDSATVLATAEITTLDADQEIVTFNVTNSGTGYTGSGYVFLNTLNTSLTSTTVDITADANGHVTTVKLNSLGSGALLGDYLIIQQGDNNCVVRLGVQRDVPPAWQLEMNGRNANAFDWNLYNLTMRSCVNLLKKNVLVNFKKVYPNYYNNSYYFYGDPDNKDPITAGFKQI
jgi:hypothetical protein